MKIADTIKMLRERHNLTQEEMGKIAGVSFQAVSSWERGDREPRMGAIERMANYFGIRKSDIIEGTCFQKDPSQPNGNGDLNEIRERLRRQPGMRILFDASKGATEQDLKDAAALIEGFKRRRDGEE